MVNAADNRLVGEALIANSVGMPDWLAVAREMRDFDDRFDAAFRRLHADDRAAIRSRWQ